MGKVQSPKECQLGVTWHSHKPAFVALFARTLPSYPQTHKHIFDCVLFYSCAPGGRIYGIYGISYRCICLANRRTTPCRRSSTGTFGSECELNVPGCGLYSCRKAVAFGSAPKSSSTLLDTFGSFSFVGVVFDWNSRLRPNRGVPQMRRNLYLVVKCGGTSCVVVNSKRDYPGHFKAQIHLEETRRAITIIFVFEITLFCRGPTVVIC